ncbi:hypothetical protein J6590_044791 [Homalodisca vitripennis]|nr:hypothetical protein J6590_044791 [Homalodisca vitripennis]
MHKIGFGVLRSPYRSATAYRAVCGGHIMTYDFSSSCIYRPIASIVTGSFYLWTSHSRNSPLPSPTLSPTTFEDNGLEVLEKCFLKTMDDAFYLLSLAWLFHMQTSCLSLIICVYMPRHVSTSRFDSDVFFFRQTKFFLECGVIYDGCASRTGAQSKGITVRVDSTQSGVNTVADVT